MQTLLLHKEFHTKEMSKTAQSYNMVPGARHHLHTMWQVTSNKFQQPWKDSSHLRHLTPPKVIAIALLNSFITMFS